MDPTDEAVGQADRLGAALALPIEARSLTEEELSRRQRRLIGWMAIGIAMITIALVAAVAGELRAAPLKLLAILGPIALLLGLPLLLAMRWHKAQARAYRDPGIRIRVDEDGIIVASAEASHAIGWARMQARILSFAGRRGVRFVGVTVESPLGPIRLDNDIYANGRDAAAAIVHRLCRADALGRAAA